MSLFYKILIGAFSVVVLALFVALAIFADPRAAVFFLVIIGVAVASIAFAVGLSNVERRE